MRSSNESGCSLEEGKPVIDQAETAALDLLDKGAPIINHIVNQFEVSDILEKTEAHPPGGAQA